MSKKIVEDKSKVIDVTFKYPELMCNGSKSIIIAEYDELQCMRASLHDYRQTVRDLEAGLKKLEASFSEKSNLCTLHFGTKEIEVIDRIETTMLISNPTDASNKNYM